MLRDLHVRNLAVIAEAAVEFGSGLNVLTGETGAGKSIVVDSLSLLSGTRASGRLIRSGAGTLAVTGVFEPGDRHWRGTLAAAGLEANIDEVVIRREISREGRNRVFLNDQPVTLGLLSTLAPSWIRIHTQREELGLVTPELQRFWLDRCGGDDARTLRERVEGEFATYSRLSARLARVRGDERARRERIDLLEFQIEEIDQAQLRTGEHEELKRERDVLRNSEAIGAALGTSHGLLFEDEGAAVETISQAFRLLDGVAGWDPRLARWRDELGAVRVDLEELTRDLGRRLDEVEADPARLDAVEQRLAAIESLCRKYGATVDKVLEHRSDLGRQLEELTGDAEQRQDLERQEAAALDRYRVAATELSRQREIWAETLASRVHGHLKDLAMGKARFAVSLSTRRRESSPLRIDDLPTDFSAEGFDEVCYLLAANPGEEPAPLADSASGGELSRVYLAVQLAGRPHGPDGGPTLVFDEVDAGIGGSQAAALGSKLKRLSDGGQILVVTHLPQIASHADHHFKVRKRVSAGRTRTSVEPLEGRNRVEEVARMLAGRKVTSLSVSHAEEMIAAARQGTGG